MKTKFKIMMVKMWMMTLVETMTAVGVIGIMASALIRPWSAEADRSRVVTAQGQALNAYRLGQ